MIVGGLDYNWQFFFVARFENIRIVVPLDHRVPLTWKQIQEVTFPIWVRK